MTMTELGNELVRLGYRRIAYPAGRYEIDRDDGTSVRFQLDDRFAGFRVYDANGTETQLQTGLNPQTAFYVAFGMDAYDNA